MSLQESGEMYLETIYVLLKEKQEVRAIDVGEHTVTPLLISVGASSKTAAMSLPIRTDI